MLFHIRINPDSTGMIFFHHDVIEQYSLLPSSSIRLKIGAWEKQAEIAAHSAEDPSLFFLSADIAADVGLPEHLPYELTLDQQEIQIGPVIGILIRGKITELKPNRLNIYLKYVVNYKQLRGLILLFTVDGIDDTQKKVNGFAFNPDSNRWEKGSYVFPSAVFCRRSATPKLRSCFTRLCGNRFFNSQVFNKWEMWERLSGYESMRAHLPDTSLAVHKNELKRFIDQHQIVFLKPKAGMQGSGIFRLEQQGSSYIFQYELNGQSLTSTAYSWEDAYSFLKMELNLEKYLVQQGIPLIKMGQRVIDFRVLVQKNRHGSWCVQGIVSRLGKKNSIVSNISSGGSAEKAWFTLLKIYGQDERTAIKKQNEMEHLAIEACETLEMTGLHLGNVGMDMALDQSGHCWIIEINNRDPDATIALDAGDQELYYRLKSAPLDYAKWLTGFG
ncbi:YheC/YheD family protein [Paenibacillus beijingensis]|uniref:ATP-grasp domain-containing protein n=1 Tax=Paenibacillus beijingensis TaxID=1126833 RepID=A0A0D5NIA3_9BACL|nr:YheC/YheD family protein [Paenibacillus beijingensis]AJY74850.1 hypothetical protein VN24_09925 [Paenibacillus beijingensis]